jgi:hypothetical protein
MAPGRLTPISNRVSRADRTVAANRAALLTRKSPPVAAFVSRAAYLTRPRSPSEIPDLIRVATTLFERERGR